MGSHSSSWWLHAVVLGTALITLSACSEPTSEPLSDPTTSSPDDTETTPENGGEICVDDAQYFELQVQSMVLTPTCSACHHAAGAARNSDLILAPTAQPNHLEANRAMLTDIAGLERNGISLLLLKPIGEENHGGGAVITQESQAYVILQGFLARLDQPVVCEETDTVTVEPAETLELLSPCHLTQSSTHAHGSPAERRRS